MLNKKSKRLLIKQSYDQRVLLNKKQNIGEDKNGKKIRLNFY